MGRKHPVQWVGNTRYSGSETPDTVDLKHSRQRVGHIRYSESVPTQLPAIYLKEGANNWKVYYICRDYLGSITHIANSDGSLKQELSYDAWGRLRNPATNIKAQAKPRKVSFWALLLHMSQAMNTTAMRTKSAMG